MINWKAAAWWAAAVIYMVLIFYLSSRPAHHLSRIFPIILKLKLIHILEFGFLATLLFFAMKESGNSTAGSAAFAVTGVFLFGTTDELHQVFIATRTASFVDVFADTVGAGLATLFLTTIRPGGRSLPFLLPR